MSTTFEPCNDSVMALLRQVMREHHNALDANEVTIDAIWARRTDEDENGDEVLVPALRQHGYAMAARIQITSLADDVTSCNAIATFTREPSLLGIGCDIIAEPRQLYTLIRK